MAKSGKSKGKEMTAVVNIAGTVNPSLGKSIASAQKSVSGLKANFLAAGKAIPLAVLAAGAAALATVGVAAVKVTSELYNMGEEWKKASNIIRIGTGKTGADLEKLNKSVENVYKNVNADKNVVAQVIADVDTLTGANGEALENLSRQILKYSDRTGKNAASVTDATARSFNAFEIGADKMAGKMDFLLNAEQSFGVSMEELSKIATENSSAFKGLGYSYESAITLIGNLKKEGKAIGPLLAGMRQSLVNLNKKEIKIEVEKSFGVKIKNASDGLAAYSKFAKSSVDDSKKLEKLTKAFGTEGAPVFLDAIKSGAIDVGELTRQLEQSDETIDRLYKDTQTVSDSWKLFKHQIEVEVKPLSDRVYKIFENLTPFLDKFAQEVFPVLGESIEKLLPKLEEYDRQLQEYIKNIDWEKVKENSEKVFDALADGIIAVIDLIEKLENLLTPILKMVEMYDALSGNQWKRSHEKAYGKEMEQFNKAAEETAKWKYGETKEDRKAHIEREKIIKQYIESMDDQSKHLNSLNDEQKKYFLDTQKFVVDLDKTFDASTQTLEKYKEAVERMATFEDMVLPAGITRMVKANAAHTLPAFASGGFTRGPSLAGEAGTEAVISFDPRHRSENVGYLMRAAEMLDAPVVSESRQSVTTNVDLGGIRFSPVIKSGSGQGKEAILKELRSFVPELADLIESELKQRNLIRY